MVCRTTFTRERQAAFTLVETMAMAAVGSIVLVAFLSLLFFSNRSFACLANYSDLDEKTEMAVDKMSREIRQVNQLTGYSSTNLTFEDYDGGTLQYVYNPATKVLIRSKGNASQTLLTGCTSLQFSIFQRSPCSNTFLPYSTSTVTNTKLIELTWNCSRTVMGARVNTESMQSAKIVIRKK